jgi:acylphosphatase
MHRIRVVAKGRVQGVGYRAFVQKAVSLTGVTGYVKNLADGSVELVAEGSEAQLTDVLKKAKAGSPFSEVIDLIVTDETPTGEFSAL